MPEQPIRVGCGGRRNLRPKTQERLDARHAIDPHAEVNHHQVRVAGEIHGSSLNTCAHTGRIPESDSPLPKFIRDSLSCGVCFAVARHDLLPNALSVASYALYDRLEDCRHVVDDDMASRSRFRYWLACTASAVPVQRCAGFLVGHANCRRVAARSFNQFLTKGLATAHYNSTMPDLPLRIELLPGTTPGGRVLRLNGPLTLSNCFEF